MWATSVFELSADNDQVIGTLLWSLDNNATEVLLEVPDDAGLSIMNGYPTAKQVVTTPKDFLEKVEKRVREAVTLPNQSMIEHFEEWIEAAKVPLLLW